MDALTAFGLFAVTAMLVCYALEDRTPWFTLAFAAACAMGSIYGFFQGAWRARGHATPNFQIPGVHLSLTFRWVRRALIDITYAILKSDTRGT